MKTGMKKMLGLLLAAVLLVSLCACGSQSTETSTTAASTAGEAASTQQYTMKLVSHQMVGTARYEATVVAFCNSVKSASGGRLVIEPYGAGVLFPVTDSFTNLQNGVVDFMACWDGYWTGVDPCFALAGNVPGDPITSFSEHYYRSDSLDGVMSELYGNYGLVYLGGFDYGSPEILMSNKKITSLDDFKGLNIRTSGISGTFYAALGASPVSLASTEIYTALQLGTVDAAEYNDWLVNEEMALNEVTTYVVEPCLHQSAINDKSLIANPKSWNSLPEDLQAIVLACMKEARYNSAVAYDVGSSLSRMRWIDSGVEVITLPEEEVVKAEQVAVDIINEYKAKGGYCEQYIDVYKQVLMDLGYEEFAGRIN